jgi:WD40 repeat protein
MPISHLSPTEDKRMRIPQIFALTFLTLAGPVLAKPPEEFKGHKGLVYYVAFSPDGKTMATASFDDTAKLWEFATGKELQTLKGHTAPVYCVAFSPDGKTVATASQDKTIRLWNPADGKMIRELKGHTDTVDFVAWSPDGKTLASASGNSDKSVRLWNPEDGKEIKNLGAHKGSVYTVDFSPDGKLLVSASADATIKIWDVAAKKEQKELKIDKSTDAFTAAKFLKDGKIVSVGFDRHVRIWNPADGKEIKKLGPTPDDIFGLALSQDGKKIATAGYGGSLRVWETTGDKATFSKDLKFMVTFCIAFSPDGTAVITGHDKNFVAKVTPLK